MVVKKQFDEVRRTWWIWWLDCNKQGTAAVYQHVLNVFIALAISQHMPHDHSADQCTWYLITYLSDVLLGTFLAYLLIKNIDQCLIKIGNHKLASGNYYYTRTVFQTIKVQGQSLPTGYMEETVVDYRLYLLQCFIWLGVLTVTKAILVLLQLYLSGILQGAVTLLLSPTEGHPTLRLLTTFMFIPMVLNALQIWIQDNFLKKKGTMDDQQYVEEQVAQELSQGEKSVVYIFKTSEHHSSMV